MLNPTFPRRMAWAYISALRHRMRESKRFCQRGSNSENLFLLLFLSWRGKKGSIYHYKRTIIGPPAKLHLNCVSLACRWRPNIESGLSALWFFKWSEKVLLRNPIFSDWLGLVRTSCLPPPSRSAHASASAYHTILYLTILVTITFQGNISSSVCRSHQHEICILTV